MDRAYATPIGSMFEKSGIHSGPCYRRIPWNPLTDVNLPLSGTEKHPNFQVTSCLRFVTTNVDFAYIESE